MAEIGLRFFRHFYFHEPNRTFFVGGIWFGIFVSHLHFGRHRIGRRSASSMGAGGTVGVAVDAVWIRVFGGRLADRERYLGNASGRAVVERFSDGRRGFGGGGGRR